MSQNRIQIPKPHHNTSFLTVLESIVAQGPNQSTTLVICTSKPDFLTQLRLSISSWQPPRDEIPASQEEDDDDDEPEPQPDPAEIPDGNETKHALLTPTLHLLATSQNVRVVFCPSINSLRAFISVYEVPTRASFPADSTTSVSEATRANAPAEQQIHSLEIVNSLSLHNHTSEFTYQGLTRTFASIASAVHRTGAQLQLIECPDVRDSADPERGMGLWDCEVPLLSSAVRIGDQRGAAGWVGRRVRVKGVVQRWFCFEEQD